MFAILWLNFALQLKQTWTCFFYIKFDSSSTTNHIHNSRDKNI